MMDTKAEVDLIRQKIMAGLGVSEAMMSGSTTYATSSISARMAEASKMITGQATPPQHVLCGRERYKDLMRESGVAQEMLRLVEEGGDSPMTIHAMRECGMLPHKS
jgi:hypothetical protein